MKVSTLSTLWWDEGVLGLTLISLEATPPCSFAKTANFFPNFQKFTKMLATTITQIGKHFLM